MNGNTLSFGLVAGLALVGVMRQRGSRAKDGADVTLRTVLGLLKRVDGTDDEEWVRGLQAKARAFPAWTSRWLDPRKDLNNDCTDKKTAKEYAKLGMDSAPPIVVIPSSSPRSGERGRYDILDGAHRALAAEMVGRKVLAFLPKPSMRGSRATARTLKLAELPRDMKSLLGDFMEERYGSDEGEVALPTTFPIRLVPVEPLFREVQHDAWDDRGPEHVARLSAEMARLVPKAERIHPEAIADRLLALVPHREYSQGQYRPRAPGVALPPIVTFSGRFADGRHRLFAAHQLGITHLPAIEMDDLGPKAGSRATARPPTAFRDLAAWTTWARTEGVELRLVKTPSYTVEITDLFADTTGTGAGTRVMQALVQAADKAGMPLTLHPSSRRNVTFYERFGFVVTGRDGMMRREPKRGSRAATTAPVVLYHGAQRWEGPPEIVAHRKGHAEHGPGIYLTTSYETAARYAKGGGSVYRMELRPGVRWLQDAKLDKEPVLRWLKGLARLRGKEKLVAGVERVTARTGDTFPAEILVNQFVNEGASSGQHGPALAAFLVENGVDASLTSPPMFGGTGGAHGEDWVIVFNPDILRSVTKVTAREVGKQAPFDLPRVKR